MYSMLWLIHHKVKGRTETLWGYVDIQRSVTQAIFQRQSNYYRKKILTNHHAVQYWALQGELEVIGETCPAAQWDSLIPNEKYWYFHLKWRTRTLGEEKGIKAITQINKTVVQTWLSSYSVLRGVVIVCLDEPCARFMLTHGEVKSVLWLKDPSSDKLA